jgi:hypothetical protein
MSGGLVVPAPINSAKRGPSAKKGPGVPPAATHSHPQPAAATRRHNQKPRAARLTFHVAASRVKVDADDPGRAPPIRPKRAASTGARCAIRLAGSAVKIAEPPLEGIATAASNGHRRRLALISDLAARG